MAGYEEDNGDDDNIPSKEDEFGMNHNEGVESSTVLASGVIEMVTMFNKGQWGSMEGGIMEAVNQINQFMVSSQSQGTTVDFPDSWSFAPLL